MIKKINLLQKLHRALKEDHDHTILLEDGETTGFRLKNLENALIPLLLDFELLFIHFQDAKIVLCWKSQRTLWKQFRIPEVFDEPPEFWTHQMFQNGSFTEKVRTLTW